MSETTAEAGSTPATEEGGNPSAEGSRTFTQEQVNKLVGDARMKERAKLSGQEGRKDADDADLREARGRVEALEAERDALLSEKNAAAWKEEASKATGVPAEVLEGATKEAVEAHAERLKPYFAKAAAPVVDAGKPSSEDGADGDWLRAAINGN